MIFTFFIAAVFCDFVVGDAEGQWGYREVDQRLWGKTWPACNGKRQSPIAINTRLTVPVQMPVIEMVGYQNPLAEPVTLKNTGKTASITASKVAPIAERRGFFTPYIFGGPLTDRYAMESLHFHWGDRGSHGAEHVINSRRHAMEMHIVHRNTKYKTMSDALSATDGIAVIGVFYRVVEKPTKGFHELSEKLGKIRKFNQSLQLDFSLSLSELMVGLDTTRFYTYAGSLTTPPCAEAVTWLVYPDPVPINMYEMSMFRKLRTEENYPLVDNYRHVQTLNRRRIFRRVVKSPNDSESNEILSTEENFLNDEYDYNY